MQPADAKQSLQCSDIAIRALQNPFYGPHVTWVLKWRQDSVHALHLGLLELLAVDDNE